MTTMLDGPDVRPVDSIEGLSSQIVGLAGRLAAATCDWLLLIAEFDARDGRATYGCNSTAHWLTWACGVSPRTARDHVRVARALAASPALVSEMSAGRLSYSHVRAISRAARGDEAVLVDDLVMAARHGTVRQLESMVRGLRTVRDHDEGQGGAPDESVTTRWTSQSQWQLSARLDPERGAVVTSALDAVARAHDISRTEALVRLAEIGLATLADSAEPPRPLRGDERAAAVIHIDADLYPASGSREPDRPVATVENGPGLPAAVVERLLCAGRVRSVLETRNGRHRTPLDVGRSHRLVTDKQFRALRYRDGGCAHPTCDARRNVEAHHVRHWLNGGPTDMDNLVLLCQPHHLQHHEGEFTIEALGDGRFRFLRDGAEIASHPVFASDSTPEVVDAYHHVAPSAMRSEWDGSRLDLRYAVSVLAQGMTQIAA